MTPDDPAPAQTAPVVDEATPWRRFWARSLDVAIWGGVLGVVLHLIWPGVTEYVSGYLHLDGTLGHYVAGRVQGWVSLPFVMILDALSYDVFGNTPGKWIGGIRALDLHGSQVPFRAYLRRNFGVYWYGLGTDFPVVGLFTLISSHHRASSHQAMSWDEVAGTRVFAMSTSPVRTWAAAIGTVFLVPIVYAFFLAVIKVFT
jgi:uncharacterized RDD family membrane protein YckC